MELGSHILRGILGMAAMLGILFLFSAGKRRIDWLLVGKGILLQVLLALAILKIPLFNNIFKWIADRFVDLLMSSFGYIFAFQVLPTIVFFSAFSAILYYLGIMQRIVQGFAWVMSRLMNLSGAESLAAAANVFIGQTEAPLVIKPYLERMSKSEMLCLMTGGMATIAGGVFAAYVGYLGGTDLEMKRLFATHLLTASIISAPAAIVAAKILYPKEEGEIIDTDLSVSQEQLGSNLLDAISIGTTDGLKLAINVGAMLLVFTALVAGINYGFNGLGNIIPAGDGTLNEYISASTEGRFANFSLEYILGLVFSPLAWLLGVPSGDTMMVGQLLGQKTVINEFYAYAQLEGIKSSLEPKSLIIVTYALCGFANFASIGIQIGGIGAIAPGQRKTLAAFGIKALIGGTIAAFMTAIIAGVIAFGDL